MSPVMAGRFFTTEAPGKPLATYKVGRKGEHFFLALSGLNRERLFFPTQDYPSWFFLSFFLFFTFS